jgi:hypothetical protein
VQSFFIAQADRWFEGPIIPILPQTPIVFNRSAMFIYANVVGNDASLSLTVLLHSF